MKKKIVIAILCCVLILLIIIIFLLFPPTPTTHAVQDPGFRLGEVTKFWFPKRVPVSDGFIFRYKLWDKYDTAIYYTTGQDTFEVTTTFKKWTTDKPALPDIVTKIDDNITAAQKYFPTQNAGDNIFIANGWNHFKGQSWNKPHYNNTLSFVDNVAGAYVELSCVCYKIEWWSEKRINHGIVTVEIDGGNPQDVDLYDPREDNNSLKVFTSPNLTNTEHTIRVNYTGRKNSAASQTNVGHDYFVTYKKQ